MRTNHIALPLVIALAIGLALLTNAQDNVAGSPAPHKLDASLVAAFEGGGRLQSLSSESGRGTAEIGVLIRVKDGGVDAVEATGAQIGTVAGDVVSATATLDQIREIAALPSVVQISSAQREPIGDVPPADGPDSAAALDESIGTVGLEAWRQLGYDGSGVIIGFVDTGIDWKHKDFRFGEDGEASSRILRIWDQLGTGNEPNGFNYGTEWTREQIEADLANPACPPQCTVTQRDTHSHGTHVSSTAAGDGSSSPTGDFAGVAPNAYIVHVKSQLFDSTILDGAAYIYQIADAMGLPGVVSLSVGGLEGSHDGTSLIDSGLAALLNQPGRAMVVAAGNEGNALVHAGADVPAGGSVDIEFTLPNNLSTKNRGSNTMEFWYQGQSDLCFTLTSPNQHSGTKTCLGESIIQKETPDGCITIINAGPMPNGDNQAQVYVDGPFWPGCDMEAAFGTWSLNVATKNGGPGGSIDGWMVPGDHEFDPPFGNTDKTVTEPGTSPAVITAGSFVSKTCWEALSGSFCFSPPLEIGSISSFSGKGPTRSGEAKPDITAPGQRVFAALSDEASPSSLSLVTPDGLYLGMNGTSMATPHVAGAAALILQAHPDWMQPQVKEALMNAAIRDEFTGRTAPAGLESNTWGAGKLRMPPPPMIKGDLNCDNKIQSVDGLAILTYVAGFSDQPCVDIGSISAAPLGGALVVGDMDCDLDVDAVDALNVLKYIAALPVDLVDGCAPIGSFP